MMKPVDTRWENCVPPGIGRHDRMRIFHIDVSNDLGWAHRLGGQLWGRVGVGCGVPMI